MSGGVRRLLAAGFVAVSLALPDVAAPAADGPGRYFQFRTLDTGNEPTTEASQRCREHFGPVRSHAVAIELDAELFGFTVDTATGRVVDETTELLGPGYLCAIPGDGARLEAWAFAELPGVAEVELAGPCDVVPVAAQPGAAFFNCRLRILPDLSKGILGGFATSNSVVNPGNAVPGNPTGSVWTAYVIEVPE